MVPILVTGGAGFIGSHLVDKLLANKTYSVSVIDNFNTGNPANLPSNVNIFNGDISDLLFVKKVFESCKPSIVVHAAASYEDPDNWEQDIKTNILGMSNLVEVAEENSVQSFIYLQTSLCYGLDPIDIPIEVGAPYFNGSYDGGSSYGISKTAAELYLSMSKLSFKSFRLANVYGPRNFSGPIPIFFQNILNGTKSKIFNTKRDFIYVDDVVDCILASLKIDTKEKYFNISTGKDVEIQEMYELIEKKLDKSVEFDLVEKGNDDTSTILIDSSLTQQTFGWKPKVSVEEGIEKTVKYYNDFGVKNTYTHLRLK